MKKLFLSLVTIVFSISAFAQLEVKQDSFKEVPGFVNINIDKMYDDNNKPYAVLKVRTENINDKQRRELTFGGDAQTFFEVEYKDGEVWLYISYYATFLKVSHPDLSSTEFYFPFDMEPKKGYEMVLSNKSSANEDILQRLERLEKLGNQDVVTVNQTAETPRIDVKNIVINEEDKVFSVGPSRKVYFAKGNLQYQGSTKTWRFADNQWDVIGKDNQNISSRYKLWIDLFGWGTGKKPAKDSKNGSDYKSFVDWGSNPISNGDNKKWFTLSGEEWVYVFDKRYTNSGVRFAKAIVNGVDGIILLPDGWNSLLFELHNANDGTASFNSNMVSQKDWIDKLEANGAVFLPVNGCRRGNSVETGMSGGYWSSTKSGTMGDNLRFYNQSLNTHGSAHLELGLGVRLVRDAK